jgi:hypothetical protein
MTIICRAPGCSARVAGYSGFCSNHAKRKRRHGHCDQQGVTAARLKPHLDLVRSYIVRRGGEALQGKLEAVLNAALADAKGTVAEALSGRPFHRYEAEAAVEFVRVVESSSARAIIETVAAMTILIHREPGAFKSDDAARVQTSRRFRCLSPETKRRYLGRSDCRTKTVSRDLRLAVSTALGRRLHEALGAVGLMIAEGADAEHQRRAAAHQEAYAALRAV